MDATAAVSNRSASESNVVSASPVRITGPAPCATPGMTALDSTETTMVSFGRVPASAMRRAPNNPPSSARVKTPYTSVAGPSLATRSNSARMAAHPARSSTARILIVSPSRSKSARSNTTGKGGSRSTAASNLIRTRRSEVRSFGSVVSSWGTVTPRILVPSGARTKTGTGLGK